MEKQATANDVIIAIAHYGLDRKITEEECRSLLKDENFSELKFIDFEIGSSKLNELYDLPFENVALTQQRKFNEIVKPILIDNPNSIIAYFGLAPIPVAFHFGSLIGNTHPYVIYQWHHTNPKWFKETQSPSKDYTFDIQQSNLPQEIQKGKGDVTIRISTSFNIDPQATYDMVPNPANEFDIVIKQPHVDSLFSQKNIQLVVEAFQDVLNCYSNKLSDREKIHLFIASSAGLPFALGTRINPNVYPFIQTYQFNRSESPKYREAIFISRESDEQVALTEDERKDADVIRSDWNEQLQNKIKPFIQTITGKQVDNWLQTICSDDEYIHAVKHLKPPWSNVTDLKGTSLKDDKIDSSIKDIEDGFEYDEKTNSWFLDDGFLSGLKKRLIKNHSTDLMQAGRLFFFHEALHYSTKGHRLTKEIAKGIGQFPKVIEEADYQADVWGLLSEYKFCSIYFPDKLRSGIKQFFCNVIETAVETMWSFLDNGPTELTSIQIRSVNRFLNWYWQWLSIENLEGQGKLEDIIHILFDKPVIELAGAPILLRAHRSYFKLNVHQPYQLQLALFINNKIYRFSPNLIEDILDGFRFMNGEKIKTGLKSFQVNI